MQATVDEQLIERVLQDGGAWPAENGEAEIPEAEPAAKEPAAENAETPENPGASESPEDSTASRGPHRFPGLRCLREPRRARGGSRGVPQRRLRGAHPLDSERPVTRPEAGRSAAAGRDLREPVDLAFHH